MARPRIIETPEEAWEIGQGYFGKMRAEERPLTVTGLALALGLSGRQSLIEYEGRPEFSDTIKALRPNANNTLRSGYSAQMRLVPYSR
ncbi:MAG: hypothetical protein IPG34_17310 [Rhodocyclaceae bacterium]|nr:hypothetical protein [Rhodocyclaceae bacterium]